MKAFCARTLVVTMMVALARTVGESEAQNASRVVAAPGYAVSLAALPGGNEVAVLAGTAGAKGVFLIDTANGDVVRSFSVASDATAVSAGASPTEVVVALDRNGTVGALERWSREGVLLGRIALPGGVRDVAVSASGVFYALVEHGRNRAAVKVVNGREVATFPLPATSATIGVCHTRRGDLVLTSDTTYRHVAVLRPASRALSISAVYADSPSCADGVGAIFALTGTLGARAVTRFSESAAHAVASTPVDGLAYALTVGAGGELYILSSSGPVSSIEIIPGGEVR